MAVGGACWTIGGAAAGAGRGGAAAAGGDLRAAGGGEADLPRRGIFNLYFFDLIDLKTLELV